MVSRLSAPATIAAVTLGAAFALGIRDPHVRGSWIECPLLWLTGWACPLCGGLSCVHDIVTGDWSRAVADNAYVVFVLGPALVAGWAAWTWLSALGDQPLPTGPVTAAAQWMTTNSATLWCGVGGAGLVFWVVRNLPWGAGLNPYY